MSFTKQNVSLTESSNTNTNKVSVGVFYTLIVSMLPFFATYASGIPGFSLADVLLGVCTLLCLFSKEKQRIQNKFSVDIIPFIFSLFLILLTSAFASFYVEFYLYDVAVRTIRYFFYMFCIFYISYNVLYCRVLNDFLILFSVISSAYIFVQYIAYTFFNKVLLGFLPFLNLYVPEYGSHDYELMYSSMYRPASLFLEPAHYARYAVLGLALVLFATNRYKKKFTIAFFITFGVLISTSTQGYALLILVWGIYLLRVMRTKLNTAEFVFGVVGLPLLVYILFQTNFVVDTINRTFEGSLYNLNSAIGARLGGIFSFLELDTIQKITGLGFGVVPSNGWLTSAVYWLYGSGVVVFCAYVAFILYYMTVLKGYKRMVLFLFFVLFFTDDSFYNYMCVIFWSIILVKNDEEEQFEFNENIVSEHILNEGHS